MAPGDLVVRQLGGRRYFVRPPPGYNSSVPHSLVLSFHGLMSQPSDAPFFAAEPRLRPGNVVFVFPEGLGDSDLGSAARSWNGSGSVGSPGPAGPTCVRGSSKAPCHRSCARQGGCGDGCWLSTCADDVGFVLEVLEDVSRTLCIDGGSVHAVGFSNGAMFALELGTNERVASRFRTIVAIAGVPLRGFNRPPALRKGARFLGIYGRGDTLVPAFPNRPDDTEALASTGWVFSTWRNTSRLWAATLGCGALTGSSALRSPGPSPLSCFDYACSEGGVSVCLWGGPHAVPPTALDLALQAMFPERHEAGAAAQWALPRTAVALALAAALAAFGAGRPACG